MDEDQFFAAPPAEEPPAVPEDGGFTLLGEATDAAPPSDDAAAFVGDVQDGGYDDMGFAGGAPDEDAFAAPPAEPTDDAPIVLGPPPEVADTAVDASSYADDAAALMPVSSEPSAMQKWNEEWQVTLSARKDEENAMKAEMVESARVALEEFKAGREAKREAKMAKNREDEQAKLEDIEADLENDNSWQRVSKMVDLTQDGAESGVDTTRMRDMFILLKNDSGLASKVA